jgi:Fibrobacter succinogenes major domain (Fib_succ_major).
MKFTKAGEFIDYAFAALFAATVLTFLLLTGCSTEDAVHSPEKNGTQMTEMGGASEETGIAMLYNNITVRGRVAELSTMLDSANKYSDSVLSYKTSAVRMYELDSVTFDTVGSVHLGYLLNPRGEFRFDSVSLNSPYILLEVSPDQFGGYGESQLAERTGLTAVVDLRETKDIEINKLTCLEGYRLRYLVQSGMSIAEARLQAGRDVLDAFGMYKVDFETIKTTEVAEGVMAIDMFEDFLDLLNYGELDEVAEKLGEEGNLSHVASSVSDRFIYWTLRDLDYMIVSEAHGFPRDTSLKKEIYVNFAVILLGLDDCDYRNDGRVVRNEDVVFNFKCSDEKWDIVVKSVDYVADSLTDERDGKTYKTATYIINGEMQTWMSENLMFGEGTGDYLFTEVMNIDGDITDSSGFIDYDRVYAIMDSVEAEKGYYQGVCPDGWHLPNGFEWQNLMNFIEGKLDIEYDIGVYLFAAGFGVVVDSTAMKDVIVYAVRPDPARGDVTLGGSKDNALYIDGDGKWVISQNNDNHVMRVRCVKDE